MTPAAPTAFTSLNSRAYFRLVRSYGPSDRNWEARSIRNGFTSLTHAFGSLAKGGSGGFQTPSGIPASAALYRASNTGSWAGTMLRSILYAAVAAAASFESVAVATRE